MPENEPKELSGFQAEVRNIIVSLGEDPMREGLRKTPARVEAAMRWLTRGYRHSVSEVVGRAIYNEPHENMILVRDIELLGSSRVDLQACKLEYSIVSPK